MTHANIPSRRPRGAFPWIEVLTVAVILFTLFCILVPAFVKSDGALPRITCRSNLRQIAQAIQMYADDYDRKLPPAAKWCDSAYPYLKTNSVFACPIRSGSYGYAFNALLDRRSLNTITCPATTPAAFDTSLDKRNAADSLRSFVTPHRKRQGTFGYVAFLNGEVRECITPPAVDALRSNTH